MQMTCCHTVRSRFFAMILGIVLLGLSLCAPRAVTAGQRPSLPPALSLLNETGQMRRTVSDAEIAGWKRRLHRGAYGARAARLHLWLGEIEIARNREPDAALRHFAQVRRLAKRSSPLYGCAAYDRAMTLFFDGAYAAAALAFQELISPKIAIRGYSLRDCALRYRHVAACAGYHEQHAKLGITEPTRLAPLCGVESLAACLRTHGRPYDRKTLLANCRVTGLGNGMKDLLDGARRLGMSAACVKADEEGLKALPKPLVAFVEQDHFVAVTHADNEGVSYLCSDCGAWPGGRRDLTWKQWRAMDCCLYLAVALPGSEEEGTLQALPALAGQPCLAAFSSNDPRARCARPTNAPGFKAKVRLLSVHVVLYDPPIGIYCGKPPTIQQDGCNVNSPKSSPGDAPASSPGASGPGAADPVNLATGEEEYRPGPDLVVYNPIGPSVVWQRQYGSLRGFYRVPDGLFPYAGSAFGLGWDTVYDYQVVVSPDNTKVLFYEPNGAAFEFDPPSVPTASTPKVACPAVNGGVPMLCVWNYNNDGSLSFTITSTDRSQRVFSSTLGYALTQIVDRNGNFINFVYGTPGSPGYLLTAITDSNNRLLLTIRHNARFNITSVSDRYGCSVLYRINRWASASGYTDELTQVSQIVRIGSFNALFRYRYGYINNPNGDGNNEQFPALHTITVPAPTGRGVSVTTLRYNGFYIGNITDANGNTKTYTAVDTNDTNVTVTDPKGRVVYSYTVNFDGQMRLLSKTDGTNQTVVYQATYQSDNAYQPATVTDGNSHTTAYTYDPYGQIASMTSPRNVTTTYTRDYSVFPLGELKQIQEGGKTPTTIAYYEPSGLIQSVTMPTPGTSGASGGVTTSFTYDNLGNILTVTRPGNDTTAAITTTLNYTQDGSYHQAAAIGQPLTVTDNLGHVTRFRYDVRGNRVAVVDALGNRTDIQYNIADQQGLVLAPALGDITNQLTVTRSQLTYNPPTQTYTGTLKLTNTGSQTLQGYLLAALTNLAPGVTLTNTTGTYVNSPTLLSGQVSLAPNAPTTLNVSFSAPSANAVNYGVQTYLTDSQGNPLAQRSATQSLYLYVGGPLVQTNIYDETGALYRQVNYGYGKEGELRSVSGSTEPVTYTYDAAYRLQTLADGNGNATKWAYNTAGWLASVTYPMGDGQQYPSYDAMGHVLKRIDGRGIETDYTYNDPESNLTNVQYVNNASHPTVSQYNVALDYDGYGRTQDVYDHSGHTHLDFDDLDAQIEIDTTYVDANGHPLPTVALTYGFNPDGSHHAMSVQIGATDYTWSYGYDASGRWKSITNPFNEMTQWSYLDNNGLASQQHANGVNCLYAYNRRGLLNDLTLYASNGSSLSDFGAMVYDAVGSRLTKSVTIPGAPSQYSGQTAYTYDIKDQLTQEQSTLLGGYTENFSYDPAGNPLSFKGQAHSFNADNDVTDTGFAYDGEGNPTAYAGTPVTFDPENHMTAFGSIQTAGYRYDGMRTWKQMSSGRTYFIYRYHLPVIELDDTGTVTAVNTFGNTGLLSRHTSAGSVFYAFDPQGSVAQRLDTTGTAFSTSSFDAFGAGMSTSTPLDPFGYCGQFSYYTDQETNLMLLGHRYYGADRGRFLVRDPINFGGGINLYAYVRNNPIGYIDPDGYEDEPSDPYWSFVKRNKNNTPYDDTQNVPPYYDPPYYGPDPNKTYPSICIEFPARCWRIVPRSLRYRIRTNGACLGDRG